MANENDLHLRTTDEVLRNTDRDSYGVVRILHKNAGTVGEEREYEPGDEALVDAGQAEWVVAPVHQPSAGRRLDSIPGGAEREAAPLGGIEVFPPAEPTPLQRRGEARSKGYVDAHTDEGLGERLESKRAEAARSTATGGEAEDVKTQAAAGGLGARTGPGVTAADLLGDDAAGTSQPRPPAKATKATTGKES